LAVLLTTNSGFYGRDTYIVDSSQQEKEALERINEEFKKEMGILRYEAGIIRINVRIFNAEKRELLSKLRPRVDSAINNYFRKLEMYMKKDQRTRRFLADSKKFYYRQERQRLECPDYENATICL
jgi:hypothetical protein